VEGDLAAAVHVDHRHVVVDGSLVRFRALAGGEDGRVLDHQHGVLDQHGLPVANVHFDDHPNDVAMREHAQRQGQAVYEAVGAKRTIVTPPYPSTHNLGTCRMSERPVDGVVDRHGRAHDVPNLFVSDGSQFTSGAAANPTLTIVALAIRQAEYIAGEYRRQGA
jgi:choline dehydrogenase-like flavoprotein